MFRTLVVTAALAVCAPRAQDSRPLALSVHASDGGGVLLSCGPQRVLCLAGTPHEMGRQHGALLADEVRTVVRETLAWTHAQGLSRQDLAGLRAAAEPFVPRRYAEELAGLAEGSRVPLEDLWLVHMMPSKFHCTGAAAARSATRDGKVYHLRSLDYALDIGVDSRLQSHALLIVRQDEDGIPSVVPSWAGVLGAVTGMNGAGIAIGEMGSQCKDEDQHGIPMIFQVREVLRRATTLAQAVAVFREGPQTCGYHFVVSSGDEREAVALEVSRSHFAVFRMGDANENQEPHTALKDVVRRANHFVAPDLAATQRDPYDPRISKASSWQGYARMTEFLGARLGTLDDLAMIELLRLYPKGHGCLHQAVLCPSDRVLWVAQATDERRAGFAGAQNQAFVRYELRALLAREFAKPLRVAPVGPVRATERDVDLVIGGKTVHWRLTVVQSSRTAVVWRAVPDAGAGLPELEVHAPHDVAKGAPGVVLVGSGEPAQVAARSVADGIAAAGVPTLVLPLTKLVDHARALRALLPSEVDASKVGYLGLGLGAGRAWHAAAQDPSHPRVVVAFTTPDLATRIGDDAELAAWLGLGTTSRRSELATELGGFALDPKLLAHSQARLLIAADAEKHLPRPEQERFAETLGAELWWHAGSVRSVQKDARALGIAVREFLGG